VLKEKQKCDEQARGTQIEGKMSAERLKKVWTELTEFSELQA
jgi:hypothetical protein